MRRLRRNLTAIVAFGVAWVLDTVDLGDVLTAIGLALIAVGLWPVSHAAALAVPGAVLVYYALPTRPPFIATRPRPRKDGD